MSGARTFKADLTTGYRPRTLRTSKYAAQRARAAELDDLRTIRPLTDAEYAEADRLAHAFYMRVYRQQQAERWGAGQ